MPPPTPYSAVREAVSRVTVRIATLNRASGWPGSLRCEVADRAAVDPSRRVLELADDLHRAYLGRAGDRAAREQPAEHARQAHVGFELRRHGRRELPDGLESLGLEDVGPGDRAGPADPAEVVAEEVHDHRVLRAVLRRGEETLRDGAIFVGPPAARCSPLHRLGDDRAVAELEEELRRGREHSIPAEVEIGRERATLGVGEVAVQPARISFDVGAQAHRVVHLVGLAGRDQLADPVDGGLVPLAGRRRHPRSFGGRGDAFFVAGERQRGLLGALEHREPGEGQCRERILGVAGTDDEGRVEAGRGLVGRRTRRPRGRARPPPRPLRAVATTSPARVASSTPTGSTSRNEGEAPVRSSNRASSMPSRYGLAFVSLVAAENDAAPLIASSHAFRARRDVRRRRFLGRRVPAPGAGLRRAGLAHATRPSRLASITAAAARAPGGTPPRPPGSPGSRSRSAT